MTASSGWVSYVPGGANEHLSAEQREAAGRLHREESERRGGHAARVVVELYENGEAVPQIQFPKGHLDPTDGAAVSLLVRRAAAALAEWR
jgi:hypothetical protein